MDYIRENYSNQDLGLNHICDYLNISTSRFSSIFKEATGRTFTEVLTGVRMERAKQLLRQTSLKNYEIAEKVGFSDPHYFSIAFKKMTGKLRRSMPGELINEERTRTQDDIRQIQEHSEHDYGFIFCADGDCSADLPFHCIELYKEYDL